MAAFAHRTETGVAASFHFLACQLKRPGHGAGFHPRQGEDAGGIDQQGVAGSQQGVQPLPAEQARGALSPSAAPWLNIPAARAAGDLHG